MKCSICGMSITSIEEAMENSWVPFFLEGEDEHGPCCDSCAEQLLYEGTDGIHKIRKEFCGRIVYLDDVLSESLEDDVVLGFILN
ncbi:MAG: hypothetical protein JRJ03_12160 [Deltaproteobacteria bacterium]|nr:hypothetical protein [Deltaproteobacteria bacterium]